MIKFFRKIRQNLLSEGQTGKYLKYALGEILLVMIGILLALQINTWDNSRKLKKEEFQLIKSLHKEFTNNLTLFDESYDRYITKKANIEAAMSIDPKIIPIDSLAAISRRVLNTPSYDPFQGIYNSMINTGKIELISNDILKEKVSTFQGLQLDYQESEETVKDFLVQNLHNFIITEGLFKNYQYWTNKTPVSIREGQIIKERLTVLFESDRFESSMIFLNSWMNSVIREGLNLRKEIIEIIKLLELELEELKY